MGRISRCIAQMWLLIVGLAGCQLPGRTMQVERDQRPPTVRSLEPAGDSKAAPSRGRAKPESTVAVSSRNLGRAVDLEPAPEQKVAGGPISNLFGKLSKPKRVPLPRTDLDVFDDPTGDEISLGSTTGHDFSSP